MDGPTRRLPASRDGHYDLLNDKENEKKKWGAVRIVWTPRTRVLQAAYAFTALSYFIGMIFVIVHVPGGGANRVQLMHCLVRTVVPPPPVSATDAPPGSNETQSEGPDPANTTGVPPCPGAATLPPTPQIVVHDSCKAVKADLKSWLLVMCVFSLLSCIVQAVFLQQLLVWMVESGPNIARWVSFATTISLVVSHVYWIPPSANVHIPLLVICVCSLVGALGIVLESRRLPATPAAVAMAVCGGGAYFTLLVSTTWRSSALWNLTTRDPLSAVVVTFAMLTLWVLPVVVTCFRVFWSQSIVVRELVLLFLFEAAKHALMWGRVHDEYSL